MKILTLIVFIGTTSTVIAESSDLISGTPMANSKQWADSKSTVAMPMQNADKIDLANYDKRLEDLRLKLEQTDKEIGTLNQVKKMDDKQREQMSTLVEKRDFYAQEMKYAEQEKAQAEKLKDYAKKKAEYDQAVKTAEESKKEATMRRLQYEARIKGSSGTEISGSVPLPKGAQ